MSKNQIQKEDVLQVANDLDIKVNEKIILWVIMNYGEYQDNDPSATWNLVVEQMLYDIPEELSIKTFNFYLDQKVTTWMRTNFSVEGEDIEVARQKAVDFVKEGNTSELSWDEIMDTKEVMSLEENGGMSTEEIFEENGTYVYVNGKDSKDE
jgi:hypothetical protein